MFLRRLPGDTPGAPQAAAQCPEGERETKSSAETVHLMQSGESVAEQPVEWGGWGWRAGAGRGGGQGGQVIQISAA